MAEPQPPAVNPAPAANPTPAVNAKAKIKRRPKPVTSAFFPKKPPANRPSNTSRPQQVGLQNGTGTKPSHTQGRPTPTAPADDFEYIPIVTTKRVLLDNLKHHVLRFLPNVSADQQDIDIFDQAQFQRPVRLHRRDPRANNVGQPAKDQAAGDNVDPDGKPIDDKDRERHQIAKAEKHAERERLQADTAPTAKSVQPKKKKFKRHMDQPHTYSDKVEKKDRMNIRYEEKLPWHIEDFDDKNVWRGTYETALSQNHIALQQVHEPQRSYFRMIPLEKWYKFTPKGLIKEPLSYEAAEKAMQKGARDPLWVRRTHAVNQLSQREKSAERTFFVGKEVKEDDIGGWGSDNADIDNIDFEEDFADDEEAAPAVGKEEEEQQAETKERVGREMKLAPVFDIREDKDFDAEAEVRKIKEVEEQRIARKTQRSLMKREKDFRYEVDDDGNPHDSDTESEDSEIERQKEEERKQEEERKATDIGKGHKSADNVPSGASTKGTNTPTPSSMPSKSAGLLRSSLKRPGSPNLSEASGNESAARKKHKKKQHSSSQLGVGDGASISRTSSPANGSTHMAAPQPRRQVDLNVDGSSRNPSARPGAGSGSDGEMSDGSPGLGGKRMRVSNPGSPSASRPGSPSAGSTKKQRSDATPRPLPSVEVLQSLIPAEGITMAKLLSKPALRGITNNPNFKDWFHANTHWEKKTNSVWPKGSKPQPQGEQKSV